MTNNQARDPNGKISEIFKLENAVLDLMNLVLVTLEIPEYLQLADISCISKNKNSRMDLANDRGIFLLSILRKVLDKLVYNEKYPDKDLAMSVSNIGARKNKTCATTCYCLWNNKPRGQRGQMLL